MKTFITTVLISMLLASPVSAKILNIPMQCFPTKQVVEHLNDTLKQAPEKWGGAEKGDSILHIYRTADSKDFTVVVSMTNGNSCIVYVGKDLTPIIWTLKDKGSAS